MDIFTLSEDYIELSKLLKSSGLCATGGMAKNAIENGRVVVDGEVEYRKGCKIRQGRKVEFDGHIIEIN
jgi:ribosome-associated protein